MTTPTTEETSQCELCKIKIANDTSTRLIVGGLCKCGTSRFWHYDCALPLEVAPAILTQRRTELLEASHCDVCKAPINEDVRLKLQDAIACLQPKQPHEVELWKICHEIRQLEYRRDLLLASRQGFHDYLNNLVLKEMRRLACENASKE